MLIVALLAAGVALRPRRWVEVAVLGAAALLPWWAGLAGVAAAILAARRQARPDPFREVAYLQAVSAELRAGRSLRQALVDAGTRAPEMDLIRVARLCQSGRPMDEVARAVSAALPETGRLAGAAVRIAAESGGRVSQAFATLAGIQADRIELRREIRASGSAARASVAVLTILPIGGLAAAAATGSLSELMSLGGFGPILVGVGAALLVLGAGVTVLMGRRLS